MAELLFNAAWWAIVLLAGVGVVVFVTGNRRQQTRVRTAGVCIVALAVLLLLCKFWIDTPEKKVTRQTHQFIDAAVAGDWTTFRALLEPTASLRVLAGPPIVDDAAAIARLAQDGTERIRLRSAHLSGLELSRQGPFITASFDLFSQQDFPEAPVITSGWQIDYELVNEGWKIREIRAIRLGDLPSDEIQREMKR